MKFKRYEKIYALHKSEVDGILDGFCFVQEKIDGANTSIWLDEGKVCKGSRNMYLESGFNGFCEYVDNHEGINALLRDNPEYRLYGEWLKKHSISYKETNYNHFYLFDIEFGDKFLPIDEVYNLAIQYKIRTPHLFGYFENPTLEDLKEIAGRSVLGERGEGIVIKNMDFINQFYRNDYAKLVTEKFKESNSITFGGNNKKAESYWELYIVNKYITLARVKKILNKVQSLTEEKLDMKHIPRVVGTTYNDMLTEEIWEIQKKVPALNFKTLKRLSLLKIKQIYIDILNDDISVADKPNEEKE